MMEENDIVMVKIKTSPESEEFKEFIFSKGNLFNDKGDRGKQYCLINNSTITPGTDEGELQPAAIFLKEVKRIEVQAPASFSETARKELEA